MPPVAVVDPSTVQQGIVGAVSGTLTAAELTWGPGEVTLTGDVSIGAGQTLTINPNTDIRGAFGITVDGGSLKCNGVFEQPVTLFDTWLSLRGGAHALQFCILNSAGQYAIEVDNARFAAWHLSIQRYAQTGIWMHGENSEAKIDFATIGSKDNLFTGNDAARESTAVRVAAESANNGSRITNSILGFLHNASNTGLVLEGPAPNFRIAYSVIAGTGSVVTTENTESVRYEDPGIFDIPNLDHRLGFYSPAIDTGDPAVDFSLEPVPNGGRANPGYFGATPGARSPQVAVVFPNGCEQFQPGDALTVKWRSSAHTGPKSIEFSSDGGNAWQTLANVTTDSGSQQVTLPDVTTKSALIRFSRDSDPTNIQDVSNRPFAVGVPVDQQACSVEERCPVGNVGCKPLKVICYTGYRDGQQPGGGPGSEPSFEQVQEDILLMAPYTHGIRTYGSDPDMHNGKHVPVITDALGLELHLGIWIDDEYSDTINFQALDDGLAVAAAHPSVKSLIVGSEYMLRVRQRLANREVAEARLVEYIDYVRANAPPGIEVVTAESYPDWLSASRELFEAVDRVVWHVHPWWEQQSIDHAQAKVKAAHEGVLARMRALNIDKPELLGETGYPWGECNGASACGSEANQARYLQLVHEYSLQTGLEYWFFSGFDESWKSAEGPVGAKWGMWSTQRTEHTIVTDMDELIAAQAQWPQPP